MHQASAVDEIIKKFGGPQKLANLLGKSRWSVHRWRLSKEKGGTGGQVPPRMHEQLLQIARAEGVALAPSDLMPWLDEHQAAE